jgi:RNA polymerase sigma-70 factor (ECF subfamily)
VREHPGPPAAPPADLDDAALVAAVVARQRDALAEAYRRHGGAVWGLARRVCRDTHLAEDVCQTVFVDLWSRPERYAAERGSLRAWLLTQAHGRAVDLVRAEAARRRRQDREAAEAPPAVELDTGIYVQELAAGVRRAVGELPAAERDPILLAYFGGHTYKEAAAMLRQPEGTVKSRIRAGLSRLRQSLEAQGVTA